MYFCEKGHRQITMDSAWCPLCAALEEIATLKDLMAKYIEDKVEHLKTIAELKEKLEDANECWRRATS